MNRTRTNANPTASASPARERACSSTAPRRPRLGNQAFIDLAGHHAEPIASLRAATDDPSLLPALSEPDSKRTLGVGSRGDRWERLARAATSTVSAGNVRVRTSPEERAVVGALGARALATSDEIWLGPGQSQTPQLMAHELEHVRQQRTDPSAPRLQLDEAATPAKPKSEEMSSDERVREADAIIKRDWPNADAIAATVKACMNGGENRLATSIVERLESRSEAVASAIMQTSTEAERREWYRNGESRKVLAILQGTLIHRGQRSPYPDDASIERAESLRPGYAYEKRLATQARTLIEAGTNDLSIVTRIFQKAQQREYDLATEMLLLLPKYGKRDAVVRRLLKEIDDETLSRWLMDSGSSAMVMAMLPGLAASERERVDRLAQAQQAIPDIDPDLVRPAADVVSPDAIQSNLRGVFPLAGTDLLLWVRADADGSVVRSVVRRTDLQQGKAVRLSDWLVYRKGNRIETLKREDDDPRSVAAALGESADSTIVRKRVDAAKSVNRSIEQALSYQAPGGSPTSLADAHAAVNRSTRDVAVVMIQGVGTVVAGLGHSVGALTPASPTPRRLKLPTPATATATATATAPPKGAAADSSEASRPVRGFARAQEPAKDSSQASRPVRGFGREQEPARGSSDASPPVRGFGREQEPAKDSSDASRPVRGFGRKQEPAKNSSSTPPGGSGSSSTIGTEQTQRMPPSPKGAQTGTPIRLSTGDAPSSPKPRIGRVKPTSASAERIKQVKEWWKRGKISGDVGELERGLRENDPEAHREYDEAAAAIKRGENHEVEPYRDDRHSTPSSRQRISTGQKVELENSAWLKGELPNEEDRRKYMAWLEKNHSVGDQGPELRPGDRDAGKHEHLSPGSRAAEAMLNRWRAEEQ
ncbi:hypothetical protein BH09MYX1_BH09MYX1_40570 [soil metagenome]